MAAGMSASPYLSSGDLQRVLPEYEFPPAEIYTYYPFAGARSTVVRMLLDFLVEELKSSPHGLAPS
jgi:DNA-binding transcriptional LysR family regulator